MHNTQIVILILLLYASFKGFLYASFVGVLRLSHEGLPRSSTAIPQKTPELVSFWKAFKDCGYSHGNPLGVPTFLTRTPSRILKDTLCYGLRGKL
ncbi:unnamed protein product [Macrosiphum euphorbiae]|uniref:Secreted protein n=1 Tax=Macrosiphum euphorbiae TaxID=13131 RepID=A0AAV0XFJ1_9HEMI|nr:unnamed protein product [Macrosiphum euphorbiae]